MLFCLHRDWWFKKEGKKEFLNSQRIKSREFQISGQRIAGCVKTCHAFLLDTCKIVCGSSGVCSLTFVVIRHKLLMSTVQLFHPY